MKRERDIAQLEAVGAAWSDASQAEGVLLAGHGRQSEVSLAEFTFMGAHPQNSVLFIGKSGDNLQALAAHPGIVVIVKSGDRFYPAVTTVTQKSSAAERGLGFTRVPVAINPTAPELSGGVLAKLKELQAQQDERTGSTAYDVSSARKDVAGHGGAALLRVRDTLSGRDSDWSSHASHDLARQTGGFALGVARAGLYSQRVDGRVVDLPAPLYGALPEHPMFIYSEALNRAVGEAVGGLSPEQTAIAAGIVAVSSVTEQPERMVVQQLMRGF